ncbi:hypothetical protein ACEQPO_03460 [Bacillus sp. SL00103]
MIHSVLQTTYQVHKTDGNFNNHIQSSAHHSFNAKRYREIAVLERWA